MRRVRRHPRLFAGAALVAAAGALVAVAAAAGFGAVGDALARFAPLWLVAVVAAQAVAQAGYVVAYRAVVGLDGGPDLPPRLATHLVAAGFGAEPPGGFALDTRALRGLSGREDRPVVRVLGLGALEWALLAPAACVCAIVALATGSDAQAVLLWSWAVAVPCGFAIGLSAAAPERLARLEGRDGWRGALHRALAGVGVLRRLLVRPLRHAGAWAGMAVYWAADILSFWAALRAFGLHLGAGLTILAYATGYAVTRRSLPLGGAAVTEVLMALALTWVGTPLAAAVAPVALYRVASFVLPLAPALVARARLAPLLDRGDRVARSSP